LGLRTRKQKFDAGLVPKKLLLLSDSLLLRLELLGKHLRLELLDPVVLEVGSDDPVVLHFQSVLVLDPLRVLVQGLVRQKSSRLVEACFPAVLELGLCLWQVATRLVVAYFLAELAFGLYLWRVEDRPLFLRKLNKTCNLPNSDG
jgi:hypothetical protein